MCGRFAFKLTWKELHDLLRFGTFPERLDELLRASYNVAPSAVSPIVSQSGSDRGLHGSRWGFVPSWWSGPVAPRHAINTRSETVAASKLFRDAFSRSRCIVPASGYFEWQALPEGVKQPYFIHRADDQPLLMAGIHDQARGIDGSDTYAILTTSVPHGMESLHDRSPVILEAEHVDAWLDASTPADRVQALCRPAADGVLAWHKVAKAVGNVRNNTPELIVPVHG